MYWSLSVCNADSYDSNLFSQFVGHSNENRLEEVFFLTVEKMEEAICARKFRFDSPGDAW